jgi:hypothetical protein
MITFLKDLLKLLIYFAIGYFILTLISSKAAGFETIEADKALHVQSTYESSFLRQEVDYSAAPVVKLVSRSNVSANLFKPVNPEALKYIEYARTKALEASLGWAKVQAIIGCEGGELSYIDHDRCSYAGCGSGMGPFQLIVNTAEHCSKMMGRTIDRANFYDNIDCGIWLLVNEGDRHWRQWSGHCWDK